MALLRCERKAGVRTDSQDVHRQNRMGDGAMGEV